MKLKIVNTTTTKDIKDEFARAFPGLKLEFVRNSHGSGEGSKPEDIIKGVHTVGEMGDLAATSEVSFTKISSVNEVEAMFREKVGLNVQVFRRSGPVWIETVNTDHWTLEMQMDASHG